MTGKSGYFILETQLVGKIYNVKHGKIAKYNDGHCNGVALLSWQRKAINKVYYSLQVFRFGITWDASEEIEANLPLHIKMNRSNFDGTKRGRTETKSGHHTQIGPVHRTGSVPNRKTPIPTQSGQSAYFTGVSPHRNIGDRSTMGCVKSIRTQVKGKRFPKSNILFSSIH